MGRSLSVHHQILHVDLDETIASQYKKPIRLLFLEVGEERFRQIERETFFEIMQKPQGIVSVGGGAQIPKGNWDIFWLQSAYLRIDPEAPYLQGRDFASLKKEREKLYQSIADRAIPLTGTDLVGDTYTLWEAIHSAKYLL